MSTTTIRLDDDLKERVAAAAQREGRSPHAFILEAIARSVDQAELEAAFDQVADARWDRLLATGEVVDWDQAKVWMTQRAQGEATRRPATTGPAAARSAARSVSCSATPSASPAAVRAAARRTGR